MAIRLSSMGAALTASLSGVSTSALTVLYARRQNTDRDADSCEFEAVGGSQVSGIVSSATGTDFRGHTNWASDETDYLASTLGDWSWRLIVFDDDEARFYHHADEDGGSWTEWTGSPISMTAHDVTSLIFGDNGRSEPFFGDYAGIRAWSAVKTPANMIAEISSRTPVDTTSLVLDKLCAGSSLSAALAAGTGAMSQSGAALISEMPETLAETGEEPEPYEPVLISGSADIDLEGAPTPDPGTAPEITTSSLPAGQVGVPYSAQVVATGTQPITLSATGLPVGLSINAFGQISGTPTGSGGLGGTYMITVTAINAHGGDTEILSLTIADAGVSPPVITTEQLPSGTVGSAYSVTFAATGAGPYSWTFSGLPPGVAQSGATISSGSLPVAGNYTVGVRVSGAGGSSAQRFYPLSIAPRPAPTRVGSPWGAALKRGR